MADLTMHTCPRCEWPEAAALPADPPRVRCGACGYKWLPVDPAARTVLLADVLALLDPGPGDGPDWPAP